MLLLCYTIGVLYYVTIASLWCSSYSVALGIIAAWVLVCSVIDGILWYEGDEESDLGVKKNHTSSSREPKPSTNNVPLYSIGGHVNNGYKPSDPAETSEVCSYRMQFCLILCSNSVKYVQLQLLVVLAFSYLINSLDVIVEKKFFSS